MGGGQIPTLLYDNLNLPIAFAVFTFQPALNSFLSGLDGTNSSMARLGTDLPVTSYVEWAVNSVEAILASLGSKPRRDLLEPLVLGKMPVVVNPTRLRYVPAPSDRLYRNLPMYGWSEFPIEICRETVAGAEFLSLTAVTVRRRRWTLAAYRRPDGRHCGILRAGSPETEDEVFSDPEVRGPEGDLRAIPDANDIEDLSKMAIKALSGDPLPQATLPNSPEAPKADAAGPSAERGIPDGNAPSDTRFGGTLPKSLPPQ